MDFMAFIDEPASTMTMRFLYGNLELANSRAISKVPKYGVKVRTDSDTAFWISVSRKRLYSFNMKSQYSDGAKFILLKVNGDILEFSEVVGNNLILVRTNLETDLVNSKGALK
jgi:hypothetical protein